MRYNQYWYSSVIGMEPLKTRNQTKSDSFEEFEFFDAEDDLNIDQPISSGCDGAQKLSSGISTVISALCTIIEEQGIVVRIPVKALTVTAVGALTGSLLGGPPGLAVGLLTGAIAAYKTSPKRLKNKEPESEKFTIRQIFKRMTFEQKKELVRELLNCLKQSNVRRLILEVLNNDNIRDMAVEIVTSFMLKRMGISLVKPN